MKSINILKQIEDEERIEFMSNIKMNDNTEFYEYIGDFYEEYISPVLKEKSIKITDELVEIFDNTLCEIQFGNFDEIKLPHKYCGIIFQINKERKKEFANMICDYILTRENLINNK